MEYRIDSGIWREVIAVPSVIVDDYIKLASGASLKVLLYMLRNTSKPLSCADISSALNLSEETVEDSFAFWEQLGVLKRSDATVENTVIRVNIYNSIPQNTVPIQETIAAKNEPSADLTEYSPAHLKPTEIAAIINADPNLKFLSQNIQKSFGRHLTYSEENLIIWMHETLGFKPEVILTLCEYCVFAGKANARYIETMANSWHDAGITTLESANAEAARLAERKSYIEKIVSLFKLPSYPSSNQCAIIENWLTLGFSDSLILYAYDRTIDSIGKLKFPYINKILMNWHENGLKSREDVENFESGRKAKSDTIGGHSYDLDKFEALAIGANTKED